MTEFRIGDKVSIKGHEGVFIVDYVLSTAFNLGKGPMYYATDKIQDDIFYAEELTLDPNPI